MLRLLAIFSILAVTAPFASAQIDQTPWHLEVEWEIGNEESDVYFSFPRDLVIGTGDQIYLSDRREPVIRVLTKTGEEVMTIGREGQGPGEFMEVTSLLAMPDGGVLAHDRRGGRLSQFDSEGGLQRTITIPETTIRLMWLAAYDEDSDRLAFVRESTVFTGESPLLYWADLSNETLGEGVIRPGDYMDLEDPVFGRLGSSPLAHNAVVLENDGRDMRIAVFSSYYTGAWAVADWVNGSFQATQAFFPEEKYALLHATHLDISEEEWKLTRADYNMSMGSYGQRGTFYTDIHTAGLKGMQLQDGRMAIVFASEETRMDGYWVDVFTSEGTLVGRHPISHDLDSLSPGASILASDGLGEVYFLYYTPERVPIIGRGRLVPQD
jgi:hypothetical protein